MLALFFQLKMMQSLQFIATMYDDLSEVTGKSAAAPPPFRQALTTMLTATSQAVVAEIDKQLPSVQDEFATLKTSLTDPTFSATPVKLQIPPNQFEAVKQKTYIKLNKPYTAPSAPATVPPVESKVYNFQKGNAPLRMGFSWYNSDWSFSSNGSGYIENEYTIKPYISDMIADEPNWNTTNNMNSGSDLGIYNNLNYEPFEPIGFTVRKNRDGNVVAEGSSEIEIVSQRHVTGETTVTISELVFGASPRILKEFLLTPGSKWGKIGKNSKSVRVDNAIHNFLTFYNVTFKAFKSDGSPDAGLKLQLGERGNYGSYATWIEDNYREEFNIADMSDITFDIDGQLEFTHGQTREVNQIYLIADESGIQIVDSEGGLVLQHNRNWSVAKVPKRENSKEFMKVSELGCHLIMTRNRSHDSMDYLTVKFADRFNDSNSMSLGLNHYQFANWLRDDESDYRKNLSLGTPGQWSLFTSTSTNIVRSITFVSEKDANEEMIFNEGASNEFKLKSGESYGDSTETYAQTITEALRGTALLNHLDGRQYKLDCRSILQGPKMNSWSRNPTFEQAKSSYQPKIAELGLQKVDDLQQIDGGDLVIDSVIFTTADTLEDGSMEVGFSNGDKPDFVKFYHIDYCWYVKPSDYKYYNITFANGSPNVQTNGSKYRQSDDRYLRDDDFQVQLWLSTGNINLENRWTDNLISLDDLKNANWWFISSVNNGTEPLNTPLTSNQASANTAPPPSANTPYAGSNYPSANVIDMYKVSTGATWDTLTQTAIGNTDTLSLQLASARIEYTQHVNNDGEMKVYGIPPTGNEVEMNTYYYKESERQWYAPYLNTYDFSYVTSGSTFPINVVFRDPNYQEIAGGGFNFTPENYDALLLSGIEPEVSVSTNGPGTLVNAYVPYTVGPVSTLPHDMHDMSLQIGIPGSASGQPSSATMPLINPLAAIVPQAANTIATFSTDGLVNLNVATPVEYGVQQQVDKLKIKVEQAEDGSVKVTYHSPSLTTAMFSGPALGTFIHKGYQWYVDPTTYKSYEFISSTYEINLYQLTYLPNGELDMIAEASVNSSYQIPRDGFVSIPLTELNTGSFWFGGSSNSGTEPLNTPLTMKENFDTFPGIPDFWKELENSDYPGYSNEANITYNAAKFNPFVSVLPASLIVTAQEYGDDHMNIKFEDLNGSILTEFLYAPDGTVRAQPAATGGNYALYEMIASDTLVNVQFKAYDWQGNDMIAAGGNGAAFWVEECENVRTLYPEHIAGVENNLGMMMDNFTQFIPHNNFTNNVPLIQIMAGKFHVEVNNKVANIIRPLNGNPIKYMDGGVEPKISKHLLVEFGESGRYLNFFGVHEEAMSAYGISGVINDGGMRQLLTQFEVAWPSNLADIPATPMKFRSTPQTRPLNLQPSSIDEITFVSSIHETDKLILGIPGITLWGDTELIASNQEGGKWYNSYNANTELIWNALIYGNTFTYQTTYVNGSVMPMPVSIELPSNPFGYADNF